MGRFTGCNALVGRTRSAEQGDHVIQSHLTWKHSQHHIHS